MRVNITYSVDFEEVISAVSNLIDEIKQQSFSPLNEQLDDLLVSLSQENEKQALQIIDKIRLNLAKVDFRLMDCEGILKGYRKALADKDAQIVNEEQKVEKASAEG